MPEVPVSEPSASADLPDWLKGSEAEIISSSEEAVIEKLGEEITDTPQEPNNAGAAALEEISSDLPAWMRGIDQESLKEEVEEEISSSPTMPKESSSYEDIPDWLKSTAMAPEAVEEPIPEQVPVQEEQSSQKQKHASHKKQTKTVTEKGEHDKDMEISLAPSPEKGDVSDKEHTHASRPKKKKPEPIISPEPVISTNPDELPDWLK